MSNYLGSKKFLIGNNVTIADFELYDALKWHDELDAQLISKYRNLKEYIARFENLAKVKSFLNSPYYMKNFFVSIAQWAEIANKLIITYLYEMLIFIPILK